MFIQINMKKISIMHDIQNPKSYFLLLLTNKLKNIFFLFIIESNKIKFSRKKKVE